MFYNYFPFELWLLSWNVIQNNIPLHPAFVLSIFIASLFPHLISLLPPLCFNSYTDWANHYLARVGPQTADQVCSKTLPDGVLLAEIIKSLVRPPLWKNKTKLESLCPHLLWVKYNLSQCLETWSMSEINVALPVI